MDFRVTALEENGGGGGNSSVAELEVRVEILEGTAADHETRISSTESDVDGNFQIKSTVVDLRGHPLPVQNFLNFKHCFVEWYFAPPPALEG